MHVHQPVSRTAWLPAVPVKPAHKVWGALTVLTIATATAPAMATPDLALGETVFNANCASCHTGGNNILMPEKTLKKAAIEKYLDGGFNVTAIVRQVTYGKGQMPAWEGVLDEEEIEAVANYVYATADADKW